MLWLMNQNTTEGTSTYEVTIPKPSGALRWGGLRWKHIAGYAKGSMHDKNKNGLLWKKQVKQEIDAEDLDELLIYLIAQGPECNLKKQNGDTIFRKFTYKYIFKPKYRKVENPADDIDTEHEYTYEIGVFDADPVVTNEDNNKDYFYHLVAKYGMEGEC